MKEDRETKLLNEIFNLTLLTISELQKSQKREMNT